MDLNKYDIQKQENPPRISDWKESTPVILLSEYLKMKKECGIRLCDDDGIPAICFRPGLKSGDIGGERWQIAENVCDLFLDAVPDLLALMKSGKIDLPRKYDVLKGGQNEHNRKISRNR